MDKVLSLEPKLAAARARNDTKREAEREDFRALLVKADLDPSLADLEWEMQVDADGNAIPGTVRLVGEDAAE